MVQAILFNDIYGSEDSMYHFLTIGPETKYAGELVHFQGLQEHGPAQLDLKKSMPQISDIYISASELLASNITHIMRGQRLSFSLQENEKRKDGIEATNITLLGNILEPVSIENGVWQPATLTRCNGRKNEGVLKDMWGTKILLPATTTYQSGIVRFQVGDSFDVIALPYNNAKYPRIADALCLPERATQAAPALTNSRLSEDFTNVKQEIVAVVSFDPETRSGTFINPSGQEFPLSPTASLAANVSLKSLASLDSTSYQAETGEIKGRRFVTSLCRPEGP